MILVGGFNTALDKLAATDTIEAGAVLRLRTVRSLPGGKGLHVALACATLGVPATLVGLIDDSSRTLFETTLSRAGAKFVGVKADESIRTCYALRDPEGRTTELLEPGPSLTPAVAATRWMRFDARPPAPPSSCCRAASRLVCRRIRTRH